MLTILPAIDIRGGKCVRLRQGQAAAETVYATDPVAMAREWEQQGATWLHVVDLDGAFAGHPVHTTLVEQIISAVNIPVQVGGGIRTDADLQRLLTAGAARAILGTRACQNTAELAALSARFQHQLAVGIDTRQGLALSHGWTQSPARDALALARQVEQLGVRTLIYTDTAVDGTLQGPNLPAIQELCRQVSCEVIASGGISSSADVTALNRLQCSNLTGAIVGKALYEGTVALSALQTAGRTTRADKT